MYSSHNLLLGDKSGREHSPPKQKFWKVGQMIASSGITAQRITEILVTNPGQNKRRLKLDLGVDYTNVHSTITLDFAVD